MPLATENIVALDLSMYGIRPDDPALAGPRDELFMPSLQALPANFLTTPPDWLWMPDNPEGKIEAVNVDSNGQAAGWVWFADQCILDDETGSCWLAQHSPTGNEVFNDLKPYPVIMEDGSTASIYCGVIGAGGDHAPLSWSQERATAYYSDVSKQKLVGRVYDVEGVGAVFLGGIIGDQVTNGDVRMIRRSGLSGHWLPRDKAFDGTPLGWQLDLIAPWLVTQPALPVTRQGAYAASISQGDPMQKPLGKITTPVVASIHSESAHADCGCSDKHDCKCHDHGEAKIASPQPKENNMTDPTGGVTDAAAAVDLANAINDLKSTIDGFSERLYAVESDIEGLRSSIKPPAKSDGVAAAVADGESGDGATTDGPSQEDFDALEKRVTDAEAEIADLVAGSVTSAPPVPVD